MLTISDDKLHIDIIDLLEHTTETWKLELAEYLSCQDVIIKHVMDQVLDRWTDGGMAGSSSYREPIYSKSVLDEVRRKIAKGSSEVAKREIEMLEKTLAEERAQLAEFEKEKQDRLMRIHAMERY